MTGNGFPTGAAAGGAGGTGRLDARALLLDQEFDPDTLHVLRAALWAHGRQAGLAEELVGDLVLAVHELAANAIAHGAGYGHLRLWHQPGTLSCEITDDGPGAQSSSAQSGSAQSGSAETGSAQSGSAETGASPESGGPPPGDPSEIGSASTLAAWPVTAGHGLWLARRLAARLDLWSDRRGSRVMITFVLPGDL